MRLSLEQLAAFSAVASENSFSAAARKLNKTQSAISIAIANLEVDLGVGLFDRSQRYPRLTEEGKALLRDADVILNQCANMENRANSLSQEMEPQVVVAIDEAVPYSAIAPVMQGFAQRFSHVDLKVLRPSANDCLELITAGEVSLALICTRAHYPRHLQFRRLGSIAFTNVAHRDHPLASMRAISFPELSSFRQLIYLPFQDQLPTSEYLNSPNHWRVESYLTLMDMLRDGLGWTSIPKQLLKTLSNSETLVELELAAYPFTEWMVGVDMAWSSSARSGRAGTWLREALGGCDIGS